MGVFVILFPQIRVDTDKGKLYFGLEKTKEMKMATTNLFEIGEKLKCLDDGFSFCCQLSKHGNWLKIQSFERVCFAN